MGLNNNYLLLFIENDHSIATSLHVSSMNPIRSIMTLILFQSLTLWWIIQLLVYSSTHISKKESENISTMKFNSFTLSDIFLNLYFPSIHFPLFIYLSEWNFKVFQNWCFSQNLCFFQCKFHTYNCLNQHPFASTVTLKKKKNRDSASTGYWCLWINLNVVAF